MLGRRYVGIETVYPEKRASRQNFVLMSSRPGFGHFPVMCSFVELKVRLDRGGFVGHASFLTSNFGFQCLGVLLLICEHVEVSVKSRQPSALCVGLFGVAEKSRQKLIKCSTC